MRATRATSALLVGLTTVACGSDAKPAAPPPGAPAAVAAGQRPAEEVIRDFRKVWGERGEVFKNRFLGIRTLQNPLDAWIIQEILSEVRPDVMIEAGTYHGGSAILWAMILEQLNPDSRVITIDIEDQREKRAKKHPIARERVDFLLGSSTAPEIVAEVKRRVEGKRVLVMLDSLHTAEHVLDELRLYAPMVPVGSYVIVQDTLVASLPGIATFLAENPDFEVDESRERFMVSNTLGGYLRRVR